MSKSATKKKTIADTIPRIPSTWTITKFEFDGPLPKLSGLRFLYQSGDGASSLLFGSVSSSIPVTAYAIEGGTISTNQLTNKLEVSFTLTIDGENYFFEGQVEKLQIFGAISSSFKKDGNTDGSWSATAQEEEEEKLGCDEEKHHHHHHEHAHRIFP